MGKRNPNGYGCVTKLSGNRTRPWVVRVTVYDADGCGKQVAVGYAATEVEANILLAKYNNNPWDIDRNKVTMAELYRRWLEVKAPKLGDSLRETLMAAYKHCAKCYGMKYRSIRSYQMQDCIDNCGRSYSTQNAIKNLWGHLDKFAFELDIIDKMYSQLTTSAPIPETTREPFTQAQVDALWALQEDGYPWTDTVLIFIYTGFRLMELLGMRSAQVNLTEQYFQGGEKTTSGRGRIVPIHHRILPLVEARIAGDGQYLFADERGNNLTQNRYHTIWKNVMGKIDTKKTPHEARHTFETFLDNAGGNRKCIDMLMGHKSQDTGNRVYNHKTIEQLRETIELLH